MTYDQYRTLTGAMFYSFRLPRLNAGGYEHHALRAESPRCGGFCRTLTGAMFYSFWLPRLNAGGYEHHALRAIIFRSLYAEQVPVTEPQKHCYYLYFSHFLPLISQTQSIDTHKNRPWRIYSAMGDLRINLSKEMIRA